MKSGRFFVTFVILLGMVVACDGHQDARENESRQTNFSSPETKERTILVQEGNAKIAAATALQRELMDKFNLFIASEPKIFRNQVVHTRDFAEKFNWRVLHKADRREIEGKLAQFLQLLNRVLEISAKNLITIDEREQILTWRDSAELFQKGLENFEKTYGQNFEPKESSEAVPPRTRSASI